MTSPVNLSRVNSSVFKSILGIVAVISFSGAALLGTKLTFDKKYHAPTDSFQELLEMEAETLLNDHHYEQQFIRTGPPEAHYNCHGWTFTGGKKSLTDTDVLKRLRLGRYQKSTKPESGDVVIYYDSFGNICHSGIVKATGKDGFVLVESKWGTAGRFLHLLDLPKVHAKYTFYHQRRGLVCDPAPKR